MPVMSAAGGIGQHLVVQRIRGDLAEVPGGDTESGHRVRHCQLAAQAADEVDHGGGVPARRPGAIGHAHGGGDVREAFLASRAVEAEHLRQQHGERPAADRCAQEITHRGQQRACVQEGLPVAAEEDLQRARPRPTGHAADRGIKHLDAARSGERAYPAGDRGDAGGHVNPDGAVRQAV